MLTYKTSLPSTRNRKPWLRMWRFAACSLVLGFLQTASAQAPPPQLPPIGEESLPSGREYIPEPIERLPAIQAELSVIHRRSQLVITRAGVVRMAIADPGIVDVVQYSPTELSVIGTEIGTTTLTMWFENSPDPLIYLVRVIRDPSTEEQSRIDYGKLERKLALLFPNSKVYLIPLSRKIIVKGQARDSEEAAWILQIIRGEVINQNGNLGGPQPGNIGINNGYNGGGINGGIINPYDLAASNIINMLTIPGDFQVMLRVRIAELNRSMLRRMGVNLQVLINDGRYALASTLASGAGTLSGIFEAGDVTVVVDALNSNGTATILAEPNLTVLSGHDATILSGGEFAVPTIVGINGVGGQQTVFRGFGTSMVVTPTVLDKEFIRMRIRPEFSETTGTSGAGGIPNLNTRRIDTTVQLREGQTIVLGGLLSHRAQTQIAGIPLLDGIPVIGPALFATKRATEDETELLITVTPELVRPMEPDEVPPYPGFEVTQPDNYLLYAKAFSQGPNDPSVNQLPPYGHSTGTATPVGYTQFNPAPAAPGYAPVPTQPYGGNPGNAASGMPMGNNNPNSRYPVQPMQARPTPTYPPAGYRGGPAQQQQQMPSQPMNMPAPAGPLATRPFVRQSGYQGDAVQTLPRLLQGRPQGGAEQAMYSEQAPQPPRRFWQLRNR